jgi:hypothetical protein
MGWKLIQVAPAELHAWWPLVRPGLERVRKKARASWLCEDIYSAVRSGGATMHVGYIDQRYAGVLVLTVNTDPFTAERSLLIWAAYTCHPLALEHGLADLNALAARAGLRKLIFHSPRRGWSRRLAHNGFRITEMKFERELQWGVEADRDIQR